MNINYHDKYTDFNRFFLSFLSELLHIFHQKINNLVSHYQTVQMSPRS